MTIRGGVTFTRVQARARAYLDGASLGEGGRLGDVERGGKSKGGHAERWLYRWSALEKVLHPGDENIGLYYTVR